eukprot:GILI01031655.1.p1 GENE.GILI01031655.1~~GILI01031655.1.p1  ORF type:complete len:249 (+),score=4.31 GILI01031655.1:69-815(+)
MRRPIKLSTYISGITYGKRFSSSNVNPELTQALRPWISDQKGEDTVMGVPWICHERLDFYFSYWSPASWSVQEVVRENFVSIQLSPPKEVAASVHGISITAFAYHRKVENPYSPELLKSFTKRFIAQVDPNGKVVEQGATSKLAQELAGEQLAGVGNSSAADDQQLRSITEKVGGSVCQLVFSPRSPNATRTPAKGLCRAFYHPNRRFHYVVLAAVPESEFDLVTPLLTHAVSSASELAAGSDKGSRL